jgi:hypothetical protein
MRARIVTVGRGTAKACDECGFWPRRLIEIQFSRSPMVALLCPSCAEKATNEIRESLPWAGGQGGKHNAVGR